MSGTKGHLLFQPYTETFGNEDVFLDRFLACVPWLLFPCQDSAAGFAVTNNDQSLINPDARALFKQVERQLKGRKRGLIGGVGCEEPRFSV